MADEKCPDCGFTIKIHIPTCPRCGSEIHRGGKQAKEALLKRRKETERKEAERQKQERRRQREERSALSLPFKQLASILFLLLLIGGVAAFSVAYYQSKGFRKSAPAYTPGALQLTLADYQALERGMTYEEVVEKLGGDGERLQGDGAVQRVEHYTWRATSGGGVNVSFMDDILLTKSQTGLR